MSGDGKQAAADLGIVPTLPMTDEQAAEFRDRIEAALHNRHQHVVLPPAPRALTADEIRTAISEAVTVKPGETVVIRARETWTPRQVADLDEQIRDAELDFRVVIVPGDEFRVDRA